MSYYVATTDSLIGQFASNRGYADLIAASKGSRTLTSFFREGVTANVPRVVADLDKLALAVKDESIATTATALANLMHRQKIAFITDGLVQEDNGDEDEVHDSVKALQAITGVPPASTPGLEARTDLAKRNDPNAQAVAKLATTLEAQLVALRNDLSDYVLSFDLPEVEKADAPGETPTTPPPPKKTVFQRLTAAWNRAMDAIFGRIDKMVWTDLVDPTQADIKQAFVDGSKSAMARLGTSPAGLIADINTVANKYSQKRAAEMVGMRRTPNGNLVPNPNAKWSIADTTRTQIRNLVENAFLKKTPMKELAEDIRNAGAFSSSRAKMIAKTEISRAEHAGNLETWKASGVVEEVRWDLSSDHDPDCERCDILAADSPYDINDVPPFPPHPHCKCALVPVVSMGKTALDELHAAVEEILKYSPDQPREPKGSSKGGQFASSGGDTHEAYQFYSPNVEENLTFEEAHRRLSSDDQARVAVISRDIDRQVGLKGEPHAAIGDWADGAENSIVNEIHDDGDYDLVRYSAAIKGEITNQKAVIPFVADVKGPDSVYRFEMGGKLNEIRTALDKAGIQFRTLQPQKNGAMVYVFDPGTSMYSTLEGLSVSHGLDIEQFRGRGEFLGGDTRAEGLRAYAAVKRDYEATHTRRYQGPSRSSVPIPGGKATGEEGEVTKYNPNQPRDPAGSSTGGRWSSGGGSDGDSAGFSELKPAPPEFAEAALKGPIFDFKPLGHQGVNKTQLIIFDDDQVKGVWKPADGEAMEKFVDGIRPGQQSEREAAAWEVAKLGGMEDLVSPAILRKVDGKPGVMLQWREGTVAMDAIDHWDGAMDSARAAVFDYVIANGDRHLGNWLVGPNEKGLRLIDHGLAFPEHDSAWEGNGMAFLIRNMVHNPPKDISLADIAKPYVEHKAAILSKLQEMGLPSKAVQGVRARITKLSETHDWKELGTEFWDTQNKQRVGSTNDSGYSGSDNR